MANTKISSVFGVNENGEVVAVGGTGSTTVKGWIPASEVPVDNNGKMVIAGLGAQFSYDTSGNVVGLALPNGGSALFSGASAGYFAHYHAQSQNPVGGSTNPKLYDMLGSNDGSFGANLTPAQAWANAGYVSTLDPATGALDTSIALPALGWDWFNGESLLFFWKGVATPEAANTGVFGQTASTSLKGPEFRMITTGQCQTIGYGPTTVGGANSQSFGPSTPNSTGLKPFVAGEEHSFAFAFDPVLRNCQVFVDGEWTQTLNFPAQDLYNSTQGFKIGTSSSAPVSNVGAAIQTSAMALLKGRKNVTLPATLKATMRRLHRFPSRLLTSEAW